MKWLKEWWAQIVVLATLLLTLGAYAHRVQALENTAGNLEGLDQKFVPRKELDARLQSIEQRLDLIIYYTKPETKAGDE